MVDELVDYLIARYLFATSSRTGVAARLKVIQTQWPILMLNRDHNPELPRGTTSFLADDVIYTGNFVKIALNVAHREGDARNVLPDV
jgi:hypothetical protein